MQKLDIISVQNAYFFFRITSALRSVVEGKTRQELTEMEAAAAELSQIVRKLVDRVIAYKFHDNLFQIHSFFIRTKFIRK